jgi:hypothetical protein
MNMVSIKIGTALERKDVVYPSTATPLDILEAEDIIYTGATITLNGFNLAMTDMNQPISALGVADKATLIVTIKTTNA